MSHSNFNPQQAEVKKQLADKYGKLMNNTSNQDQIWTGSTVFVLHAFIFATTVFLVASIGTNIIEKCVYGALGVGASFLLEKMKNTYLERFLNFGFMFADEKLPEHVREEAYKEKGFNGKIVAFIYTVSFALFVWGGINFSKTVVEVPKQYTYDPTFAADYALKVKSVKYAQDKGSKVTVINELNENADRAKTKLESHKAMIDAQNAAISGDSNQERALYICLVIFIGLIVEVSLFKATSLHELKQYKLTSKLDILGDTINRDSTGREYTIRKAPADSKEKITEAEKERIYQDDEEEYRQEVIKKRQKMQAAYDKDQAEKKAAFEKENEAAKKRMEAYNKKPKEEPTTEELEKIWAKKRADAQLKRELEREMEELNSQLALEKLQQQVAEKKKQLALQQVVTQDGKPTVNGYGGKS